MVNKIILGDIIEYIRIRFNNLVAIILFSSLKPFYKKNIYNINNVLFINTGLLGDVIISTIILINDKKLKQIFSNVYFLININYSDLFTDYKGGIKILFVNIDKYRTNLFYRVSFLNKLKKLQLRKSINTSFSRRMIDDEITLLNGAEECIGFENAPKILKLFSDYIDSIYTRIIKPQSGNHYSDLIALINKLGILSPYIGTIDFIFYKIPHVLSYKLENEEKKKIITLAPFSNNAIKKWCLENYLELANLLINYYNVFIILLGDKNDQMFIKKEQIINPNIIDLVGQTTLANAASIISISNLFIGNDSGLFHLAKANNIPRIGIVGGGAYNIALPYGNDENEILLYKEMQCFSCHWKCIYNYAYCLQDLSVKDVFNSTKLILEHEQF